MLWEVFSQEIARGVSIVGILVKNRKENDLCYSYFPRVVGVVPVLREVGDP